MTDTAAPKMATPRTEAQIAARRYEQAAESFVRRLRELADRVEDEIRPRTYGKQTTPRFVQAAAGAVDALMNGLPNQSCGGLIAAAAEAQQYADAELVEGEA